LLAARKLMDAAPAVSFHTHERHGLRYAAGDLLPWDSAPAQAVGHIIENVHVREEGIVLKYHPDLPLLRRHARDVSASQPYRPFIRRDESGDHLEGGGLAAAGGPQKAAEFPLLYCEREVFDYRHPPQTFAEGLDPEVDYV